MQKLGARILLKSYFLIIVAIKRHLFIKMFDKLPVFLVGFSCEHNLGLNGIVFVERNRAIGSTRHVLCKPTCRY